MLRGADGHAHSTLVTDHWQLWTHHPTSTQINAASIPLNSSLFCCSSAHRRHTSRSPVPAKLAKPRMWSSRKNKNHILDLSTGARAWHESKERNACDTRAHILNGITPLGLTMLSPRTYTIWQIQEWETSFWVVGSPRDSKSNKAAAFTFAYLPELEGESWMLKMLQIWLTWRTRQVWAGFELKA